MTIFARGFAASLLLMVAGTCVAAESLAPVDPEDRRHFDALEKFVDGMVKPLMQDNKSPSGTVAVRHRGELIFAKGYGYQDVEQQIPVDPATTLFRPGSTSKLFTWVAVMQLVEQGRLDLDADVNTYLETFQIEDTFDEPITLRHILTHTAGFEDGGFGYLIIDDPDRIMPLAESMKRYQPERVNPPGAQTAYSNYATALAGLIVANVSGTSFNDYVRENIFEPLGMTRSSFEEPLPEDLADDMAISYGLEAGRFVEKPFEIISNFGPAGAMSATATDMVRFGQALLNGGELDGARILEAETVAQMLAPAFSHDDRLMGMALGFYATDYNGFRVVGHGGDTRWFHSYLGIDPENELTFFVSFGAGGGSPVRSAFAPALYNEYFPQEHERPEPPEDFAERAARYAGTYGFWRTNFSTIEKAFRMTSVVQVAPTEEGTLVVALGDGAKQYVEVEENLFRQLNPDIALLGGVSPALMAFQENEEGEITGFVLDGLPFMSLRRLSLAATPSFNFTLLGLSVLLFLGVVARRWYARSVLRSWSPEDRSAYLAAFRVSAVNLLTLVAGGIVLAAVGDSLFSGIPFLFKAWLVLPLLATLAGLYLLYRTVQVWSGGTLAGVWARIRYTVVAVCALFMCWFYWYWNILGFQYY
ncbi:serine hydrolase domain-containing protein [Lentisalinibacter salinarum]|uniref:serine hydrolase domain-containing protein n=1 Tax=Lentisalinibacter salinarum TaxID=2992239 RepID=UPI00386DE7C8